MVAMLPMLEFELDQTLLPKKVFFATDLDIWSVDAS